MALYRLSAQVIGRSAGRSVTAAAAYRAAARITDQRTGLIHDYSRRGGVEKTWIQAEEQAPEWALDRSKLWNRVEAVETRKNSQLAREIVVALPHELDLVAQERLLQRWVDQSLVGRGMVADVAIHRPPQDSSEYDSRNIHAHILLTTRRLAPEMEKGFGPKARDWNDKSLLLHWRESWAEHVNAALARGQVEERVDHRSLEDQRSAALDRGDLQAAAELDRIPQPKLGPTAATLERQGVQTDRGDELRAVQSENELRREAASHLTRLAALQESPERFGDLERPESAPGPAPESVLEPIYFRSAKEMRAEAFLETVSKIQGKFTEEDLTWIADRYRIPEEVVDTALASPRLEQLESDSRGNQIYAFRDRRIPEIPETVEPLPSLRLPDQAVLEERQIRGVDREAAGLQEIGISEDGKPLFSTRDYLMVEDRMFGRAVTLLETKGEGTPIDQSSLNRRLRENPRELDAQQALAVRNLVEESRLGLLAGKAGTGKSRLFAEVADLYSEAGYRVQGAALAGAAAENLAQSADIEARTLASLEHAWREGRDRLTSNDVLIVDEASMIGTRQMERVLAEVERSGAKVILAGDPNQARPIEAGEAFRGLLQRHPAMYLHEIRRQQTDWQKEASMAFAEGRSEEALASYAQNGRMGWSETRNEAIENLAEGYTRSERPSEVQLALAYRRADVAALNQEIQTRRIAAGQVDAPVELYGSRYGAGDRFVFLANERGTLVETLDSEPGAPVGVKNGSFGTVLSATNERVDVELDAGRRVSFDPRQYDEFALGYAATIHKAQGQTVDRAHFLPDRLIERDLAYVAITRHRHDLRLYADRETFETDGELLTSLSREPMKDLARDYLGVAQIREALEVMAERDRLQAEREMILDARAPTLDRMRAIASSKNRQAASEDRFRQVLSSIYARPDRAQSALRTAILRDGLGATAERLEKEPAAFGRLAGRQLVGRPSDRRRYALLNVPSAAESLRSIGQEMELRQAIARGMEQGRGVRAAALGARSPRTDAYAARRLSAGQSLRRVTRRPTLRTPRRLAQLLQSLQTVPAERLLVAQITATGRTIGFSAVSQALSLASKALPAPAGAVASAASTGLVAARLTHEYLQRFHGIAQKEAQQSRTQSRSSSLGL